MATAWVHAANTIDAVGAQPTSVTAGTPTTVLVTALINDPNVIATTVILLRTDATGRALANLGFVNDTGVQGDLKAGDKVFSRAVTVSESAPGTVYFRVSAAFKGIAARTLSATIPVQVEAVSAPTVTAAAAPLPSGDGWNNTNVTVTFTCSGGSGGIASCPAPVVVSTQGAGQVISGTATDKAGNTATASVTLNIDLTPPNVSVNLSPPPDASGWNTTPVTAHFTCSDALSGIATCPPDQVITTEGAHQTVSGSAADHAGNSRSVTSVPFNINLSTPKVSDLQPAHVTIEAGGGTASLTVTLQGPDPMRDLHVALSSSDAAIVAVPSEVVIPAGSVTGTFLASGVSAGGPVDVSATLNNTTARATITVRDQPPPPLLTEPLIEGSTVVGGTGVADALLSVQIDAVASSVGTVQSTGTFGVAVPALIAGQVVTATQEFGGLTSLPSAPAVVRARPPAPTVTAPLIAGTTEVPGTGSAAATITVFVDGGMAAIGAASATGTFDISVSFALAGGQQVTATQTVGGVTSIPSAPVTVVAVPAPPSVTSPLVEGAGTLTGAGSMGATIESLVDDASVGNAIVGAAGTWTLTLPSPLIAGQHVKARQSFAGVNSAFSADVIVAARPPAPLIDTPLLEGALVITGSAGPGADLSVFLDSYALGNTVAGGSGAWILNLNAPLVAGQQAFAVQTVGGITSAPSAVVTVLALPPPPSIDAPLTDGATSIAGQGIGGALLETFVDSNIAATTTVEVGGTWSAPLGVALIGGQQVTARQRVNGLTSPLSNPIVVLSRPPSPVVDSPLIAGDAIVRGQGVAGASLAVFVDASPLGTTAVDPSGVWALPLSVGLVAGQVVTARQTVAGIESLPSESVTVQAAVVNIEITPSPSATLTKGQQLQFSAHGTLSDGSVQDPLAGVTWSSDTTSVASIDTAGLATGVGAGGANVRAAIGGVQSAVTALTVKPPPPVVDTPLISGATTVSGTAVEPGASVQLFVDGAPRGTSVIANAAGQWTVIGLLPALVVNDTVTARQTSNGIVSDPSSPVGVVGSANTAPSVDAGVDQSIDLPSVATLVGSTTDDGLPSGHTLTYSWSKVGGPGAVTFANPNSLVTPTRFAAAGMYSLRLTVSDGALTASDDTLVVAKAPITGVTIVPAPVISLVKGQTAQLTASAIRSDGSVEVDPSNIVWTSSNLGVAPIADSGLLVGFEAGLANVHASVGALASAATVVTVKPRPPTVSHPILPSILESLADDFEAPTFEPDWTQSGGANLALTTTISHGGSRSVSVTAPAALSREFATPQSGTVSVWFNAKDGCCDGKPFSGQAGLSVGNATHQLIIGYTGNCSTCFMARAIRNGVDIPPYAFTASKTEWHHLEITVDSAGATYRFDGTVLPFADPSISAFTRVDLTAWGGGGRAYFDDASFHPAAVPSASKVAGTGAEPGAMVQIFVNGVPQGAITQADPAGRWIATNVQRAAGDVVTATQSFNGVVSDASLGVAVISAVSAGPRITAIAPNSLRQGQQNITVQLTGAATHFAAGSTQLSLGDGVTVGGAAPGTYGPVQVDSTTSLTALVSVDACAVPGPRRAAVRTGPEIAELANGFVVAPAKGWSLLQPQGQRPPARSEETTVFDPNSNRLILFGGSGLATPLMNDVWVLSGANGATGTPTWTQLLPTGSPPQARRAHTAVYDSINNRMIIFGGSLAGGSIPAANDVWVLTNANGLGGASAWMRLLPAGAIPGNRRFASSVYDAATNRLIVFGGWTHGLVGANDTWVLSNANGLGGPPVWSQLSPTGPLPPVRQGAFLTFDQASNRMTMFGGYRDQGATTPAPNAYNDVWVLTGANGTGGTPQWIQLVAHGVPGSPSPRGTYSTSPTPYNMLDNRMVVVGGATDADGFSNDVSVLLNANGLGGPVTWSTLTGRETPVVGLQSSGSSYDPTTDTIIQYSNLRPGNSDVWILSDASRLPAESGAIGPCAPAIRAWSPRSGQQGETVVLQIEGLITHFEQELTTISLGPGISISAVSVIDATHLVAVAAVNSDAALGSRNITISSGTETVLLADGFSVIPRHFFNKAPIVVVAATTSVTPPGTAALSALVSDDGLPAGADLAMAWTKVAGPGLVAFADASAQTTTASFTESGTYILRLSVSDSQLTGFDDVVVSVGSSGAALISILPASGRQGQSGPVSIVGENTHFLQGATVVDFGQGVSVLSLSVTCGTCLTADVAIGDTASVGPRTVTVTTGAEIVARVNGFTVEPGVPILTSLSPASGRQGETFSVTITGRSTQFVQGSTQVDLGSAITISNVVVTSATSLSAQVTIDAAAALGARPLTVTTGGEVVSVPNVFTVLAPATLTAITLTPSGTVTLTKSQTFQFAASGTFSDGSVQNPLPGVTWISDQPLVASITGSGLATGLAAGTASIKATKSGVEAAATGFVVKPLGVALFGPITAGATVVDGAAAEAGASVQVMVNGLPRGPTAIANASGFWTVSGLSPSLVVGDSVTAVQTVNGVTSGTSLPVVVTPGSPVLQSVSPATGLQGQQSLNVAITGQFTHFMQGASQVNFQSTFVAVNSVMVTSPTSLIANISIAINASLVPRVVTVVTGTEVVQLNNGFTVQPASNKAPIISVTPTWAVALPNGLTIDYAVTDDGLPNGGALTTVWDVVSGPGNAGFQNQTPTSISVGFDTAGIYVLRITATDTQFTVAKDITVSASGAALLPPTVVITNPSDGAEITGPLNVSGTVSSPALASWVLEFRTSEESTFRTFANGTTPVANGVLGQLDPTLLPNGIGYIRLIATDTSGSSATTEPVTVVLTKNQKVGHFTVSFKDLEVALPGLAVQAIRTYDSRSPQTGDFGAGWMLDLRNVRLRDNGPLALSWYGAVVGSGLSQTYCLQPTRAHVVTVTLSDGTTLSFQPMFNIGLGFWGPAVPNCQPFAPILQADLAFSQVSGPPAKLEVVGSNDLPGSNTFITQSAWPGPLELLDENTLQPADFSRFRLTLADGRTLILTRTTGLESLSDLNGNKITITPTGIAHSSGKSITFVRDGQQRITTITDPAGHNLHYAYDSAGDLTSFTDQVGNVSTYTYDANHRLLSIKDPRGIEPIRNEYDASGRLLRHVDAFGKTLVYAHDIANRVETVTDRLGNTSVNEYDADGNVVSVTDALQGVTLRTYDSQGNTLSETNPLGHTRTYTYDANNNRLTETDPLGKQTTFTYTALNRIETITDPLGRVTQNTYDGSGNLTATRDPIGNITQYFYDARGLQTSMVDALGNITSYEYGGDGHVTKQTDALGHATTYTYDANGNRLTESKTQTTSTGPRTVLTQYQYDAQNRLTKTTYPDGSTARAEYNSIGKQASTFDQLGRETKYEYDQLGRLSKTTFPDLTSESSSYDAEGNRVTSTDRAGRVTSYASDALKRLTATTFADGSATSGTYDANGQVTGTTDATGNVTQYAYDAAGRRVSVTDALAHVTTFAYDAAGNQLSMRDANGNVTQYEYDAANRRTKVVYSDTTFDQTSYDVLGRAVSKRDQAGITTQYEFDAGGHLVAVVDALGQRTSYAYDELGNRVSQTDANMHVTQFAYDAMGRRVSRTLPLGMSETSSYDLAGRLASKTDFNGKTTTYGYDLTNRLVSKTPDPTLAQPTIQFAYGATGQRTQMVDASGTTTYSYDVRDRLLTKATPQGTLTYTYNAAGNLAKMRSSNAGGTSVDYAYDALNRLTTATDNRLASGVTTYTYDNVGNLASFVYPNGVSHGYSYSALNRLQHLVVSNSTATHTSYGYTLGPTGSRLSVAEFGGRRVDYTYDSLYRLTAEAITSAVGGTTTYTYDPVGNRLSRSSPVLGSTTYSYDANDRLSTDSYDANGNTVASGANMFGFDFENHLTEQNGGDVSIVYDGDGNRVVKTAGGVTTRYLVDDRNLTGYAQVLEEISNGIVQRAYSYGLTRISGRQASDTSFYGYDGHGSVRLLTDSTGAVTDRYDYDPFGNILSHAGNTPNLYLYAGEQNDPHLGFYYLRARYLNPTNGRFVSLDPVLGKTLDPRSLHTYLYAAGDPVNKMDPRGEQFDLISTMAAESIRTILANVQADIGFALLDQVRFGGNAGLKSLLIGSAVTVGAIAVRMLASQIWREVSLIAGERGAMGLVQNAMSPTEIALSQKVIALRGGTLIGASKVNQIAIDAYWLEQGIPAQLYTMQGANLGNIVEKVIDTEVKALKSDWFGIELYVNAASTGATQHQLAVWAQRQGRLLAALQLGIVSQVNILGADGKWLLLSAR